MNEFFTVVVLHLFAVMSPGPDFILITRQSIRHGRITALWTASGIGTGILFHSFLAVTGILFLLASDEFYLLMLKLICSTYLIYLGLRSIFRSSNFDNQDDIVYPWSNVGGFSAGLLTNVTNIKALLFFITLFGVVLNDQSKNSFIFYGFYMAIATFIWFACVSYIFTSDFFKSKFIRFFTFIEKILGVTLVIIALQIIGSEYIS